MARKVVERNIAYDDIKRKYYVILHYGNDTTGKRVKKTKTFDKIGLARKYLSEHETNRNNNNLILPQNTTISEWLEYWLQNVVKINNAQTTLYGYQSIINNHINPAIGTISIQKIKPVQIQQYYTSLSIVKNLSNNTIRKHHDLLNTAFKLAVKQDILLSNPIEKIDAPKLTQTEINYYDSNTLKSLFNLIANTRLEMIVMLCGSLGIRRSELCGLKWENVDFNNKLLYIKSARVTIGNYSIEKTTKSKSSIRTLYLSDNLIKLLQNEKVKQQENKTFLGSEYHSFDFIIVMDNGKPYRPNYISELFTKFIKHNNLPPLTLHGLRHSFATVANSLGISLFDIGKALGHSTPATTGRVYTHLTDSTHKTTMQQVSDLLK